MFLGVVYIPFRLGRRQVRLRSRRGRNLRFFRLFGAGGGGAGIAVAALAIRFGIDRSCLIWTLGTGSQMSCLIDSALGAVAITTSRDNSCPRGLRESPNPLGCIDIGQLRFTIVVPDDLVLIWTDNFVVDWPAGNGGLGMNQRQSPARRGSEERPKPRTIGGGYDKPDSAAAPRPQANLSESALLPALAWKGLKPEE